MTEGTQVITRTFDAFNRVTRYTDARGNRVQYTYDQHGNLTQLTYPDGKAVYYTYDSHDRLTAVTDWAGRVTRYTWDLAGRLRRLERPNGTYRLLSYDRAGQLIQIEERTANGVLLAFFRYGYDADGRLTSRFSLPRLPAVDVSSRMMAYDRANRLANFNGVAVTHNANGNMTNGPLTADQFALYTFDVRNRLTRVGGVSYRYDAENQRIALITSAGTIRYVLDPHGGVLPRVLVREQPDGTQTLYVYGLGLLYEVDAAGHATSYHYDQIGSTVALTDAAGQVTDRLAYAPFGAITYRKGTTDTPFLYAGWFGVQSDPNGLLYMRARYYNPTLGRFVSADPSGFAGGLNWYAYAANNPFQYVDPAGLEPWSIIDYDGGFTYAAKFWNQVRGILRQAGERFGLFGSRSADDNGLVRPSDGMIGPVVGDTPEHVPFTTRDALETAAGVAVTKGAAQSAKQATNLSRHLRYTEKYGQAGVKELENGRIRYYGESQSASKPGEMAGRRYVHEFDPATGRSHGWHETLDHDGNVRQVRPEFSDGTKTHYTFDRDGNYTGSW